MDALFAPFVQRVDRYNVVRDDMHRGGTKAVILSEIFNTVAEDNIVVAGHRFGGAGLALAEACKAHRKMAHIFYEDGQAEPDIFKVTCSHQSARIHICEGVKRQIDVHTIAEKFAKESSDTKIYPIGFATEEFRQSLTRYVGNLPFEPKEIWTVAGTGTLLRALRAAWPDAEIHALTMNFPQTDTTGADYIYLAKEKDDEETRCPPPFPSSRYYDARLWSYVRRHASQNALIYNVAS
jgi:hypothetical protein